MLLAAEDEQIPATNTSIVGIARLHTRPTRTSSRTRLNGLPRFRLPAPFSVLFNTNV
jgi:hypothetical protein